MNVLIFAGGLLAGTIVTVFLMGVFPIKETLIALAEKWLLTLTVTVGVVALAGLVNGWLVITACSILILCGILVLVIARQSQANDMKEMLKLLRFNSEVAIKEGQYGIEDKIDDATDELKEKIDGAFGKVEDRVTEVLAGKEQDEKAKEIIELIKEEALEHVEITEEEVRNGKWIAGKLVINRKEDKKGK